MPLTPRQQQQQQLCHVLLVVLCCVFAPPLMHSTDIICYWYVDTVSTVQPSREVYSVPRIDLFVEQLFVCFFVSSDMHVEGSRFFVVCMGRWRGSH